MAYRYTEEDLDLMKRQQAARLDGFQRNSGRGMPDATLRAMRKAQGIKLDEHGDPIVQTLPSEQKRSQKLKRKHSGGKPRTPELVVKPEAAKKANERIKTMVDAPLESRSRLLKSLPIPTEYAECVALWKWAQVKRWNAKPISEVLILIPNGAFLGGEDAAARGIVMQKLKQQGFQSGVFDYIVPVPCPAAGGGFCPGLWLEMKRTRKGVVSPAQKAFRKRMQALGWRCEVAKGWVEASKRIEEHLKHAAAL